MIDSTLSGYKVVELAMWTFVPTAGAVCAEWGAEVLKVEHPKGGDPQRSMFEDRQSVAAKIMVEHINRGKKSVAIDLACEEGRNLLLQLTDASDVFLTSFLAPARRRLSIEVEDLRKTNRKLIYARGSGHGQRGPDAEMAGYDVSSGWARSGLATELMPDSATEPPLAPPAIVDLQSGLNLASGIVGALLRRERTGTASEVDVSLLGTGMWLAAPNLLAATQGARVLGTTGRLDPAINPLLNNYPTADGRWIYFVFLQSDRYWDEFCRTIGRADLLVDERFATSSKRQSNRDECIREVESITRGKTLSQWKEILRGVEGPWAAAALVSEAIYDEQILATGMMQEVDTEDGPVPVMSSPIEYDRAPARRLRRAPHAGEDTEEVLSSLGLTTSEISRLHDRGVIGMDSPGRV